MTASQNPKLVFSGPTTVTVAGLGPDWGPIAQDSVKFKTAAVVAIGNLVNAATPSQYADAVNALNAFSGANSDIQAAAAGLRGVTVSEGTARSYVGGGNSTEIVR